MWLARIFAAPSDSRFLASLEMTISLEYRNTVQFLNRTARQSDSQLDDGRAPAAFILRRLGDGFHVRMLLQILTQRLTQDSHTAAMYDTNARQSGEESAVDEFLNFPGGIVHGAADYIDL
jgi:hypothetical protein